MHPHTDPHIPFDGLCVFKLMLHIQYCEHDMSCVMGEMTNCTTLRDRFYFSPMLELDGQYLQVQVET